MAIPTYLATVVRACDVTPRMRRVTVGGLDGFRSRDLPDERIKLLLAPAGEGAPRPISRTLTLRAFDAATGELDIDVALHDGPAAAWSLAAQPGDAVGIAGPTGGYEPGSDAGRMLIAGDEAALPAIATLAERLPADADADVLVEVGEPSARLELESRAALRVRWLTRAGDGIPAGVMLADAVREYDWPDGPLDVWAAGEALAMRSIRRHLRDAVGLPRERFQVVGYWRDRLNEDEAIETHLAAVAAARDAGASQAEIDDAGLY